MDMYRKPAERVVEPGPRPKFLTTNDVAPGSMLLGIGLAQWLTALCMPERINARLMAGGILIALFVAVTAGFRWRRVRNER